MAVWAMDRRCVVPVCLLIVGHWAVLLRCGPISFKFDVLDPTHIREDVIITASGVQNSEGGCIITLAPSLDLMEVFIYSICLDFVVMLLCAYKLVVQVRSPVYSRLEKLVFGDGLIYFVLVFVLSFLLVVHCPNRLNPLSSDS